MTAQPGLCGTCRKPRRPVFSQRGSFVPGTWNCTPFHSKAVPFIDMFISVVSVVLFARAFVLVLKFYLALSSSHFERRELMDEFLDYVHSLY